MTETGASFGGRSSRLKNVGGTPGGFLEFFLGVGLAGVGAYLLLESVDVHTSGWRFWGQANGMGLTLVPLALGIGVLFFNGKSVLGWLLFVVGAGIIVFGIFTLMDFSFRRTSLFNVLIMLGLLAGGLGLIMRSLRPHRGAS